MPRAARHTLRRSQRVPIHPVAIGVGIAALLGSGAVIRAEMPLETAPSWESTPYNTFSTGGAWADVDGDGWLDMVVSNGNDMSRQYVVIYHNNGDGTLPTDWTWESEDRDYHGHLDVGDVNGDGLPDVAVAVYIGPAGFDEPGWAKLYLNNGAGGFSVTPDWLPAEPFYCFSVALADADGDGDLDLSCACGDDYYDNPERQRIFLNHGGMLETTPSWESDEIDFALDVFWGDIEGDGDQDVAFCGSSVPMRLYHNGQTAGGGIATSATWESTDLPQFGNTTAFGDWDGDGFPELAVADNNQLGGDGRFKVYGNTAGILTMTPIWTSSTGDYGSHVSWIDLDLDGDLDLAAGRWWDPGHIYENTGGALGSDPVWISETNSVIENMFWGDVDNDGLHDDGLTIASGDGLRTHFPLGQAPVRGIDAVRVNGVPLPPANYAVHLTNGWVSIAPPPPVGDQNVEIEYTYSDDLDLGITNWDPQLGNYLFTNTSDPGGIEDLPTAVLALRAMPNPMISSTLIRYRGPAAAEARLEIVDAGGRLVRTLHEGSLAGGLVHWAWDRRDASGVRVSGGVYFAQFEADHHTATHRLVALQ